MNPNHHSALGMATMSPMTAAYDAVLTAKSMKRGLDHADMGLENHYYRIHNTEDEKDRIIEALQQENKRLKWALALVS